MTITDQTSLAFKPYASKFFRTDGDSKLYAIPRYKFMYYANFKVNPTAVASMSKDMDPLKVDNLQNLLAGWQDSRSVSFLIKQLDRPKIDLVTQETNQYGRRRQNYTRLKYSDVTMKLYDTSDNRALTLWINYFRYYFADARKSPTQVNKNSLNPVGKGIAADFTSLQNGFGFNPPGYARQFFDEIEIYAIFGQQAQLTKLISPRITKIDWGNFDSSDGGPTEVSISFAYESIDYDDIQSLDAAGLIDPMGFAGKSLDPAEIVARDDGITRFPQAVNFDSPIQSQNPNSVAVQPPGTLQYQASPVAQSIYVPGLGAVGGAINISPVISPFGILVFGL